jgi:WS/DGAT/MGAT family acyltransferase
MANRTEMLSPVDAAWLSMDEPTNLMVVNGIVTLDRPLDIDKLMAALEHRWLSFERFRQRVVQPSVPFMRPYWQTDPNFDLANHVHRLALPGAAGRAELQTMVSDLMSVPIDFTKPPWHYYLFDNYESGSAIMVRIHHCVADGMALIAVLLSLTDLHPDATITPLEPAANSNGGNGLIGGLWKDLNNAGALTQKTAGRAFRFGRRLLSDPGLAESAISSSADAALSGTRVVLRSSDPKTAFKGELGTLKRAAWTRPIPLADVKAIKSTLGGTVNDVLVSAVTGGLRRYLVTHGQPVDGLNFRAAIPVNLRAPDEGLELGNKFGLVFLSLPVGIDDSLMRYVEVRRRMDELKRSTEAVVTFGILNMMGLGTDRFREFVVDTLEPKATTVMTNVPGPQVPLYLGGGRIEELMAWVPQAGRLGLGVSIISYAGNVQLGVVTDAGLVPDPDAIITGFYAEFARLTLLAKSVRDIPQ